MCPCCSFFLSCSSLSLSFSQSWSIPIAIVFDSLYVCAVFLSDNVKFLARIVFPSNALRRFLYVFFLLPQRVCARGHFINKSARNWVIEMPAFYCSQSFAILCFALVLRLISVRVYVNLSDNGMGKNLPAWLVRDLCGDADYVVCCWKRYTPTGRTNVLVVWFD